MSISSVICYKDVDWRIRAVMAWLSDDVSASLESWFQTSHPDTHGMKESESRTGSAVLQPSHNSSYSPLITLSIQLLDGTSWPT